MLRPAAAQEPDMSINKPAFAIAAIVGALAMSSFAASAADLAPAPYVKAPPVVSPVYNWTGFYIGGNIGYSWGRSNDTSTITNAAGAALLTTQNSSSLDGIIGGGQIGYNWQADKSWVLGVEADIQGTGEKGNINFSCPAGVCSGNVLAVTGATPFALSQQIDWFGTVRGRVGVLAAPTIMLYGTGGLAYGEVKSSVTAGAFPTVSATNTNVGWTAGAGIEGVISGNWTAKLEYLYVDLGRMSGSVAATPTLTESHSSRITDNVVRIGINYRWGGPPVAKY
jgi:outer membrane immunogenic protein